ncbi:MAG: stage 0 sporulation family protein [Candidatus Bathyarchaeia archaeon]
MPEIVGVRFFQAGKIYYFDASSIPVDSRDYVVVETAYGKEVGKVVISAKQAIFNEISEPLRPVIRKASEQDLEKVKRNQRLARAALEKCRELAKKLQTPIKPVSAHYDLDRTRLTIFFTAEKRVDFRELVRELSHTLRTKVELRQIGARDEAKLIGGLGRCGLQLCCTTFLSELAPVSIKMAKEQNIALNPMKTSGICGRLLCCLGYEYEQYRTVKEKLPPVGQEVLTPLGKAKVIACNPLKETAQLELDGGGVTELPLSQITWHKNTR